MEALPVPDPLKTCHISVKIFLRHATVYSQPVAKRCPKSFKGICMDLTNAVPIIIPRPLPFAMVHSPMKTPFFLQSAVRTPLIRIGLRPLLCLLQEGKKERFRRTVLYHTQVRFAGPAADGAEDCGTVTFIVPVPPSLVGSPPRRVLRVGVRGPFFPPHSGTFRPPQLLPRCQIPALERSARHRPHSIDVAA